MTYKWAFLTFFFCNVLAVVAHAIYFVDSSDEQHDSVLASLSQAAEIELSSAYSSLFDRSRLSSLSYSDFVSIRTQEKIWQVERGSFPGDHTVSVNRERIDVLTLGDKFSIGMPEQDGVMDFAVTNVMDDGMGGLTWVAENERAKIEILQDNSRTHVKIFDEHEIWVMEAENQQGRFRQEQLEVVLVEGE